MVVVSYGVSMPIQWFATVAVGGWYKYGTKYIPPKTLPRKEEKQAKG